MSVPNVVTRYPGYESYSDVFDASNARDELIAAGLRYAKETRATMDHPPGTVIDQWPSPGLMVKRGTKVTVLVVVAPPCDPAYPDFCIKPWLPDLNCADVAPHHDFRVVDRDPYRFDGDADGRGCES